MCLALAALDAIVCPDWAYRTHSFDPAWGEGERMASARNGSGDDYFMVFSDAGVYLQGFDHESKMSPYREDPPKPWPGMFMGLPESMWRYRDEPAFGPRNCTFCIWRVRDSSGWKGGAIDFPVGPGSKLRSTYDKSTDDPDGSRWLLEIFDSPLPRFLKYSEEMHEVVVPRRLADAVFAQRSIPDDLIDQLCGENAKEVRKELTNLGV